MTYEYAVRRNGKVLLMGDNPMICRQLMQDGDEMLIRTIGEWEPVPEVKPRRRHWWQTDAVPEETYPNRLL